MTIRTNKNAPGLRRFCNTGGTFKVWRHEHTNYEFFYRAMTAKHGFNSVAYTEAVRAFAAECVAAVTDAKVIAEINGWAAAKV